MFLLLFIGALLCLYLFIRRRYKYFDGTGITVDKHVFLLGSFWRVCLQRAHMSEDLLRLYQRVGDERSRFVGAFSFFTPGLLIKDPEVIKLIAIKEFDNFNDRPFTIDDTVEPIFGRSLVSLKGEKWRNMRAALSPAFTSSKIRDMCAFMSDCGQQMTEYLEAVCTDNFHKTGKASVDMDATDLSTRFMSDVIATSIFGVKIDSFKTKDNVFLKIAQNINNFNLIVLVKTFFAVGFPRVAKFLGLRFSDDRINTYVKDLVLTSMKYREENNICRRDMIDILIEAKRGSLKYNRKIVEENAGYATVEEFDIGEGKQVWTDDDLVAQAILFFLGGFDTASTSVSFVLHELAVNIEIQDKLRNEIVASVQKNGERATYDIINNMKYLDMVMSEGLRRWPPFVNVDRMCLKDVDIGPINKDGDDTYTVKKGGWVWFPIIALHLDAKYWQDPLKFDPERFSDENKHKIQPFTYLPFGLGPRNCIGSRFALMESKIMLYHLLAKFKIEVCSKTSIPIVLEKGQFFMRSPNGFWLKFVKLEVE